MFGDHLAKYTINLWKKETNYWINIWCLWVIKKETKIEHKQLRDRGRRMWAILAWVKVLGMGWVLGRYLTGRGAILKIFTALFFYLTFFSACIVLTPYWLQQHTVFTVLAGDLLGSVWCHLEQDTDFLQYPPKSMSSKMNY